MKSVEAERSAELGNIFDKIKKEKRLSKIDIIKLLKMDNPKLTERLLLEGGKYTKRYLGADLQVFGILRFSNYCQKNCVYCGYRKFNIEVDRYRMKEEEIIKLAETTWHTGYKTIMLSSGQDPYYTSERLINIIKGIKARTELDIVLNIGERPIEEFQLMKRNAISKAILKHETSDPELYQELHPDRSFENRIRTIKDLKKLGFSAGSGIIMGLPNQSYDSMAKDILLFKNLNLDFIWIDPFIPHKNVPLQDHERGDMMLTLKFIALTRIITRDTYIGMSCDFSWGKKGAEGKIKAVISGANLLFTELTPKEYWFNLHRDNINVCVYKKCEKCVKYIAKKTGYTVSYDYINHKRDKPGAY